MMMMMINDDHSVAMQYDVMVGMMEMHTVLII